MPSKKKSVKKTAAKKAPTQKAAAKKVPVKKVATKKVPAKKATKQMTAKKAAKQIVRKSAAKKRATPASEAAKLPSNEKADALKQAQVSRSGVNTDKKSAPIVFSLDEIEELMASKKAQKPAAASSPDPTKKVAKAPAKKAAVVIDDKPAEKRVHSAASLADILGFNPVEKKKRTELDDADIPKKWSKYYKLLIELRKHVSDEISLHTADTLKHSSREDSGDLASYGSHQADAGTDSFDRDFALSLVSSEQDALNEIEEAILRIKDGSYGVCEVTGKPIPAARLTAVPFARYSVEGQVEHERNQRRKYNRSVSGGIFGDVSDAPKIQSSDDDDDE
ncbi:MAG: transcriptional regulator [Puniceicoccaceae bacterium]|nr:MAG: transcriptional regulator [Puniceicoccaceae bacterium]